jgi:peptidoglycan/xylan/chitin deacetylase (PgdA/CDA1 family)
MTTVIEVTEEGTSPTRTIEVMNGTKGDKGDPGDPGAAGDKGDTGDTGDSWSVGTSDGRVPARSGAGTVDATLDHMPDSATRIAMSAAQSSMVVSLAGVSSGAIPSAATGGVFEDGPSIASVSGMVRRRMPRRLGMMERVVDFAGWTPSVSGTSTVTLTDADHYTGASGTTCALMHTDGANGTCQMSSPTLAGMDIIDLTNSLVFVAMKFTRSADLTTTPLTVYFGSDASGYTNSFKWNPPSIGGVSTSKYYTPDGEWILVPMQMAPNTGTGSPDATSIKQIRIKIGSSAGTPSDVRCGAVLIAKNSYSRYPNGALAFTFDDARSGQYTYARPLLNQHGIQGTFYIVDEYLDRVGGYMTLAQVQQLRADGHVIGYHANTLAAHAGRYPGIGVAAAVADLQASFAQHLAWGLESPGEPRHFAWPGGEFDNSTWAAISVLGLTSMRLTAGEATKIDTFPPIDARKIIAGSSTGSLTSLALKKAYVDAVKTDKKFGVIAEHQIHAAATDATGTNWKELKTLIEYAVTQNVPIISLAEATE